MYFQRIIYSPIPDCRRRRMFQHQGSNISFVQGNTERSVYSPTQLLIENRWIVYIHDIRYIY